MWEKGERDFTCVGRHVLCTRCISKLKRPEFWVCCFVARVCLFHTGLQAIGNILFWSSETWSYCDIGALLMDVPIPSYIVFRSFQTIYDSTAISCDVVTSWENQRFNAGQVLPAQMHLYLHCSLASFKRPLVRSSSPHGRKLLWPLLVQGQAVFHAGHPLTLQMPFLCSISALVPSE